MTDTLTHSPIVWIVVTLIGATFFTCVGYLWGRAERERDQLWITWARPFIDGPDGQQDPDAPYDQEKDPRM